MHGTDVIAYGFEASRGTAQHAGDSALFELLSNRNTQ